MFRLLLKGTIIFLLTFSLIPGVQVVVADTQIGFQDQKKQFFIFSPDGHYLAKVYSTDRKTRVRIHETANMTLLTEWEIPDFEVHTARFSSNSPDKLLLADKKRLFVYRLVEDKQKLVFFQPKIKGQEIVQAYFDSPNDEVVWATRSTLYKTDTENKQQDKILTIPWEKGSIDQITGLSSGEYAVSLTDSSRVLLLDPTNSKQTVELIGHRSPVIGIGSTDDNKILSLDSSYELIVWDAKNRKPDSRIKLKKPADEARPLGVTLDDQGKSLLVLSKTKEELVGQKYRVEDLKKGKVSPKKLDVSITSAGNVYSSVQSFQKEEQITPAEQQKSTSEVQEKPVEFKPLLPKKKKNSLYDLAKIEAENGGYEAALRLIKKVPLDDPEFAKSRQLKRQILNRININNSLEAARDQYRQGNYNSARVILNSILAKHPNDGPTLQFLRQVEEKSSKGSWLAVLLVFLLIVLLILLGILLWWYKYGDDTAKKSGIVKGFFGMGSNKSKPADNKSSTSNDLRRDFVYKLDDTRKKLNVAAALDNERRFKNTWMEITARLNTMEKRARLNDSFLPDFLDELEKVQLTISKLSKQSKKDTGFEFKEEQAKKQKQKTQQQSNHQNRSNGTGASGQKKTKKVDYHDILGVSKSASIEEVKMAYRMKMKEYHPDRHNSSDFKWIKEEADRRTREVQEAYTRLMASFK